VTSEPGPISAVAGGIRLHIQVQPRASRSEIAGLHGGRIRIRLAAPPVDGAANEELIRFLAGAMGISKSALRIQSGRSGRRKTLHVAGVTLAAARALLEGETG
jgi:uncharacterized protein (TIGR00251 family)